MSKLLIAVRHGEYELGNNESPLSEKGREQMKSLRRVIDFSVEKTFKGWAPKRIYFSFSEFPRAIQSARLLKYVGEKIVVTDLYDGASRKEITRPMEILRDVMRFSDYYGAEVIVVVAHARMPAVIAGAAHELVTGERLNHELPYVGVACGFVVDMVTGAVTSVGWNDLPAESPPATQGSNRPIFKGPPRNNDQVVLKG